MRSTTAPPRIGPPARRPTAPTFPARARMSACAGPWTSVYVNGFAGYPGANGGGTTNLETGYRDTAWCNTHGAALTAAEQADNALTATVPSAASTVVPTPPRRHSSAPSIDWTAPAIAAGYNYPNVRNVANGLNTTCANASEDCIYGTAAHGHRQSVLLHDLQGPVLFELRMPADSESRHARTTGTRRPTSTSVTAPTRPRHSIRRRSRASTSSPRASSSTAWPPPIPAGGATRRRCPTSPSGMPSTEPACWR